MTNNKDSGGAFVMPADRTVQVPVSLIERARRALVNYGHGTIAHDLAALLSQPTPTEHCLSTAHHAPHEWGAHDGQPSTGYFCPGFVAEPLRIEDMAPGMTFMACWRGHNEPDRFVILNDGVRCITPGRWYSGIATELRYASDRIDLSTICDVTPPTEGTK